MEIFGNPNTSRYVNAHFLLPLFLISSVLYLIIFLSVSLESIVLISYIIWSNGSFSLDFSLLIDWMSCVFIATVLLIGSRVLVYCRWYISDEVYYKRFTYLVTIFLAAIVLLIFIPNIFSLILGWDGLGLTSFLLVCYYQNEKSSSAAILTALRNRIGDVTLLLRISFIFSERSWYIFEFFSFSNLRVFSLFIVLRRITKRAQLPFCSWLPAAMAAPTPVSALVHSSTLVTAGVYLLIRCHHLIQIFPSLLLVLQIVSVVTLILSGIRAVVCWDVKKIVALSTLSQLSVIIFGLSLCKPWLRFFHLITHAIFKALLFLCVGVVIHANKRVQDIRILGNNWSTLPVTIASIVVANSSLAGLPFLRGFFSKDLIVDLIYDRCIRVYCYFLFFLGVCFTSFYCMRISYVVLFSLNKLTLSSLKLYESFLLGPFLSLIFGSLFLGKVLSGKIEFVSQFSRSSNYEMLSLRGIFFTRLLYFFWINSKKIFYPFVVIFGQILFLESLTRQPLRSFFLKTGSIVVKCLDKGWLETCGPQGLGYLLYLLSMRNEKLQNNFFVKLISFFFVFFVFVLCLLFLYLNSTLM